MLHIFEIPLVDPTGSEVRVSVHAAAVNPIDCFFRQGMMTGGALPADGPLVPGLDFAGVVSAVGDSAMWAVGDEVIGTTMPGLDPTRGAYASEVIAASEALVRRPAGCSFAAASTLLMNGLTALQGLDEVPLSSGAIVAITGGAGVIGGYAIQLAKARGWRVLADAATRDVELLGGWGVDEIVARGCGVEQRFVAAAGGPVDAVIDLATIGPSLLPSVRDGGWFVSFRPRDWEAEGSVTVVEAQGSTYFHNREKLDYLCALVENGTLSPRVARTFDANEAATAHRELDRGGSRGRLVLTWS